MNALTSHSQCAPNKAPSGVAGRALPTTSTEALTDVAAHDDVTWVRRALDGDASAVTYISQLIDAAAKRVCHSARGIEPDEIAQRVRERLFTPDRSGHLRLATFQGGAALASWLRVVAARVVVDVARRTQAQPVGDDIIDRLPGLADDPELALVKQQDVLAFRAAFHAALADLPTRQRNLLRQSLVHGLSIDQLGSLYRVHRATAARWLEQARTQLRDGTIAQLTAAGVATESIASLLRVLQSRIDVSAHRALAMPDAVRSSAESSE